MGRPRGESNEGARGDECIGLDGEVRKAEEVARDEEEAHEEEDVREWPMGRLVLDEMRAAGSILAPLLEGTEDVEGKER
jgi:hypothetical protein